jgi:hypothetical protein
VRVLAKKTPRPSRLLAGLSALVLTACLFDGGDGGYNKPVTTFDFSRLDRLPNPLMPWYHVPGGKAVTGVKFAFRSLDYGRQADSNIAVFLSATSYTPAAAGAYVDLRVNAVRLRAFLDSIHARGVVPYLTSGKSRRAFGTRSSRRSRACCASSGTPCCCGSRTR